MTVTAQDILTPVYKLVASYVEELGTAAQQEIYLLNYISLAMRKLAHVAYQVKYSDPLTVSADGDVTFLLSSAAIDLYAPLRIIKPDGQVLIRRTAQEAPIGWWRESSNRLINIIGFSYVPPLTAGAYTLHYLKFPATLTATTSVVEFPESGIIGLMYYASALTLESLPNAKDLVAHYYKIADQHLKVSVQANIDARGVSTGGFVPSLATYDAVFRMG